MQDKAATPYYSQQCEWYPARDWMAMDTLELLLHPVRIRILHAFSAGRTRTTSELCARLPDVSQATIYRHVALLTSAGVLRVVDEQRVRGAVERHYALNRDLATIDQDTATQMSPDDHRRAFASAMAALLADFGNYLDHADPDTGGEVIGYRQIPLWLSPTELQNLIAHLHSAIKDALANEPTPERAQFLLSPILFPIPEPEPTP